MKKEIKPIPSSELMDAMDLVWTVFSDTAAKDCTDEGKEEFWQSTDFEHMLQRTGDGDYRIWGAYADDELIGVCVLREPCHVDMLFVEVEAQKKGVGSSLLKRAIMDARRADETFTRVTVNAFPSAVGFFEKIGFKAMGEQRVEDGIPFVPMEISAAI